jgi:hypothetical protein
MDYEMQSRHITERIKMGDKNVEVEARWDWVGEDEAIELRIAVMGDDSPTLRIDGLDGSSLPALASALLTLSGMVAYGPVEVEC